MIARRPIPSGDVGTLASATWTLGAALVASGDGDGEALVAIVDVFGPYVLPAGRRGVGNRPLVERA